MKKLFFLLALLSVCLAQICGQTKYASKNKKAIAAFEEGKEFFLWEKYTAATERLEYALKLDPKFLDCYFALADIYKSQRRYKEQLKILEAGIAIDSTFYPMAYYSAGVALCKMGQDTASIRYFDLYKRFANPKRMRKDVDMWVNHAKYVRFLIDHPVPFNPEHVSKNILPGYDLYWPSLTLDENELVLTALRPNNPEEYRRNPNMPKSARHFQEDFCMAIRDENGEWGILQDVTDINTRYANEGAQALSPDGQWMFLTICGREDSEGSCDIYFSRRTKTGWTKPQNIGQPVNTSAWESQPCLSADGQTLYFVSGRKGGIGGHDIWSAKIKGFKENGLPIFEPVKNLGATINTEGDEASPFIHPDNRTLFFSSTGWEGMGGYDIFVSRRDNDTAQWNAPLNIGYPINTSNDEVGLIVNTAGNRGYYSTEVEHGDGRLIKELFCFEIPEAHRPNVVSYIAGKVYDEESLKPLSAKLELLDLSTGRKVTISESRPADGSFMLNMPSGNDYALISTKENYLHHSETFALKEVKEKGGKVYLDMPMTPIRVGAKITLKNIFFEFDRTNLKPESFVELNKVLVLMQDNPNLTIEIGGHTDNKGSVAYNNKLSADRAKSTAQYLISKGIDANRIKTNGYGMSQPIADNSTDEGRALNRRIEIKIVE